MTRNLLFLLTVLCAYPAAFAVGGELPFDDTQPMPTQGDVAVEMPGYIIFAPAAPGFMAPDIALLPGEYTGYVFASLADYQADYSARLSGLPLPYEEIFISRIGLSPPGGIAPGSSGSDSPLAGSQVFSTPEPSSVVLLAMGSAALWIVARRRKV